MNALLCTYFIPSTCSVSFSKMLQNLCLTCTVKPEIIILKLKHVQKNTDHGLNTGFYGPNVNQSESRILKSHIIKRFIGNFRISYRSHSVNSFVDRDAHSCSLLEERVLCNQIFKILPERQ